MNVVFTLSVVCSSTIAMVIVQLHTDSSHDWHMACVAEYAARHGVALIQKPMRSSAHRVDARFRKPGQLKSLMEFVPHGDWLLYLDWDVCPMQKNTPPTQLLSTLLNATNRGSRCHLIAQDSPHTVNSGVLFIRHTNVGVYALDRWIEYNDRRRAAVQLLGTADNDPLGDQRALTDFFMEAAWRERNVGRGSSGMAGFANATAKCTTEVHDHTYNLCWKQFMERLGFPFAQRQFGGVCLVPERDVRFNMHDSALPYADGDFFFHGHSTP